jgi:GNAT superfamily N-acetyltransferase
MSSDIDPLTAMHRANQAFHEQLTQQAVLSCGVAHFSSEFGRIANQIREAAVPADGSMQDAYAEVENFYGRLAHPCRCWSPALHQPTEEMGRFLIGQGYTARPKVIMHLRPWPDLPARPAVRVLPGRAMRAGLRELLIEDPGRGSPDARAVSAEMVLARMDDPTFEVLLAMSGATPVGHACLMQVGPIAAVYDVYVREGSRRNGCALAMMHDMITACRRLELRTVVLEVGEVNTAAISLYERCGFERAGTGVDFWRKATAEKEA